MLGFVCYGRACGRGRGRGRGRVTTCCATLSSPSGDAIRTKPGGGAGSGSGRVMSSTTAGGSMASGLLADEAGAAGPASGCITGDTGSSAARLPVSVVRLRTGVMLRVMGSVLRGSGPADRSRSGASSYAARARPGVPRPGRRGPPTGEESSGDEPVGRTGCASAAAASSSCSSCGEAEGRRVRQSAAIEGTGVVAAVPCSKPGGRSPSSASGSTGSALPLREKSQ